jgi:uncharacterized protein (DUF433 family)
VHRRDADPSGHGRRPARAGCSPDDVLADYSTLSREDVLAALQFAADAVEERELPLRLTI